VVLECYGDWVAYAVPTGVDLSARAVPRIALRELVAAAATTKSFIQSRGAASAMTVSEPGLGSSADGEGEKGVDRGFERTGTPLHLGE
jgi:hypothetical protein